MKVIVLLALLLALGLSIRVQHFGKSLTAADKAQEKKIQESIKAQLAKNFANEPSEDEEEVNDKMTSILTDEEIKKIVQAAKIPTEEEQSKVVRGSQKGAPKHQFLECAVEAGATFLFRAAQMLINLLVGNVDNCMYGYLRSAAVNVVTKGTDVVFAEEYLDSGRIEKSFKPTTVTKTAFGLGAYTKVSGTATGANGVVRLKPQSNTNLEIVAFFENSWSGWSLGAVCYRYKNFVSARSLYNEIYGALTSTSDAFFMKWTSQSVYDTYCTGFDLNRSYGKFVMDYWGVKTTISAVWQKKDISSAQTCKYLELEITFE